MDAADMAFWVDLFAFAGGPADTPVGDYLYLPSSSEPTPWLIRRPLRMHPRDDGLAMSTAPRLDANRTIQASLRRAGNTHI
jgi:hypothetical protein